MGTLLWLQCHFKKEGCVCSFLQTKAFAVVSIDTFQPQLIMSLANMHNLPVKN